MFTNTYIYILFLSLSSFSAFSQESYSDKIFSPDIKTLKIHQSGWPLSYPAIELGGDRTIAVSFDALMNEEKSYQYKLIHCNANHKPSGLSTSEYIQGMHRNYIEDYNYSFNTNVNYIHYSLSIPNETMTIKKSGVYALVVYEKDERQPILTACFYVYENLVDISPTINYNSEKGFRNHYQQLEIAVNTQDYTIDAPLHETNLVIRQNNRRDNELFNIKPTFTRPGYLTYTKNSELAFEGGNEYFYFDASTSKYSGHGVAYIDYQRPFEHFVLHPYEPSSSKSYSERQDINGRSVIRRQEADQEALDLESDYIFVHFFVPKETPEFTGKLYLTGELTLNQISPEFELAYNIDENRYEASVLIKQGRYEYRYQFVKKGSSIGHSEPFDADFYQTENDYQAYFFHTPPGARYDRLVGYQLFDSRKFLK